MKSRSLLFVMMFLLVVSGSVHSSENYMSDVSVAQNVKIDCEQSVYYDWSLGGRHYKDDGFFGGDDHCELIIIPKGKTVIIEKKLGLPLLYSYSMFNRAKNFIYYEYLIVSSWDVAKKEIYLSFVDTPTKFKGGRSYQIDLIKVGLNQDVLIGNSQGKIVEINLFSFDIETGIAKFAVRKIA